MSLSKIRAFPITGHGVDGFPTLGTPIALITLGVGESEVNNISFSLTPTTTEKTLNADDKQEKHTAVIGYEGSIEAYGIDATAIAALFGATKDADGNIVHVVNGAEKPVCLFLQGQNTKGKKFQKWLYEVVFKPLADELKTQTDTAESIKLEFTGKVLEVTLDSESASVTGATVYDGTDGFIEGEPSAADLYKGNFGA